MIKAPNVGDDVHYVHGSARRSYPPVCRAAKVTEVSATITDTDTTNAEAWVVGLAVFNPDGVSFDRRVVQDENPITFYQPGSWHWPIDCAARQVEAHDAV